MNVLTMISLTLFLSGAPATSALTRQAAQASSTSTDPLSGVGSNPHRALKIESIERNRIVIPGIVNAIRRVKVLIDTGATRSIISPRLANSLRLQTVRKHVDVVAGNRKLRSSLVVLESIELGPMRRPLSCVVADVPVAGVDLLIGRDVLARAAFTVDFESRSLVWGPGEPLEFSVPFDPSRKEIIVPLKVGARDISVLLDSGADQLYLFENRVSSWLPIEPDGWHRRVRHLSSERRGSVVRLSRVTLGNETFPRMGAVVVESTGSDEALTEDWQGLMGMACLDAKRVQIDYSIGLFSWER